MPTHRPTSRYGGRDVVQDRMALTRACLAARQRFTLDVVRLSFAVVPTRRRWRAEGVRGAEVVAEGRGRSADEAVAALALVYTLAEAAPHIEGYVEDEP